MGDHHVHLHPHTPRSGVGPPPNVYPDGFIERFVEQAAVNGAEEIGFTEHFYRCTESAAALGRFWDDGGPADLTETSEAYLASQRFLSLERYVEAVQSAKDRGLPVLLGMEVDFFPETIDAALEVLEPYPFDFLVGSVHWVGAWGIDLPFQTQEFDRRGHRRSYEDYFAVETELAASGTVDVLAHADVIKKQALYLEEPPTDLHETLAEAAGRSGVAIEVSTAGLYQPAAQMYPHDDLLARFFKHGVPITVSSDAHLPEHCGRDRSVAIDAARAVGYTERVTFTDRKRISVPLM
jgi:histidinol-phosphatase (PHP family)